MGKGRFIWAFTTRLHHFKEYFPIVSLTVHGKCISFLKNLSHTHISILRWSLNRWLWGVSCSLLLCKSRSSPDSSILHDEGTRGAVRLGLQQDLLYMGLNIFRRRKITVLMKPRIWWPPTIFLCKPLPVLLCVLTLHQSRAEGYRRGLVAS